MIKIITFQDFQNAENKENFILASIEKFKRSEMYLNAIAAQKYYAGENVSIKTRLQWFYNSMGVREVDNFIPNRKIASEMFPKIIKQENSYLLSNGVILEDEIKDDLGGNKFDYKVQSAGITALTDSVSWGYCYINNKGKFDIQIFRGTEIIPLYDEMNGIVMACIRFWQIDEEKPLYIELFELDGKTSYVAKTDKQGLKSINIYKPKMGYVIKSKVDILGIQEVQQLGFSVLPLFPLYANDLKQSELSFGLKSKIDAYDFINSDLFNNLEQNKDLVYFLKNYQGQGIGEFLADLKAYGVVKVDDDGGVEAKQIEVPYEARKTALELLRKDIFDDAMALDTSILSGGSLTATAIKANMENLNLKTDAFEWCVNEFVSSIVDLYLEYIGKDIDYSVKFERRSLINDTEIIDNIYKFRSDISQKTALELNPYIENVEEEMNRIDEEGLNKYSVQEEEV